MRGSHDGRDDNPRGRLMEQHAAQTREMAENGRPQTLDERAYRTIQRMLVTTEIPPASLLDDGDLARRLGIGRTPVRRALKRLDLEGLVTIYPRRGTFATDITIESLAKLSDLRTVLEGLAAEKAAQNATASDIEVLRALRRDIIANHDHAEDLFDAFKRLHTEIYRMANNPYLTNVAQTHYQLSYRIRYAFQDKLAPLATHVGFYTELIDALMARDAERARDLAAQHVVDFREEVRSTI